MKVWISSKAAKLNEQDHIDFDALAEQAMANGGDAYLGGLYHAHIFLLKQECGVITDDIVLVTTFSESVWTREENDATETD